MLDRFTGAEYACGTEAQVRQSAQGVYRITEAPILGPVELDNTWVGSGKYPEFIQRVGETVAFNGRIFAGAADLWTDGILYPDHLGIGFTERLADLPQFVLGVQLLAGQLVTSVRGVASTAGLGDPPLLGDWIRSGHFQPARLACRFDDVLGGLWDVTFTFKSPAHPDRGYVVRIDRQ